MIEKIFKSQLWGYLRESRDTQEPDGKTKKKLSHVNF